MSPLLLLLAVGLASTQQTVAQDVVVDFSPDTTASPVIVPNYSNQFPGNHLGDKFTLSEATTIGGGSIFSLQNFGIVGQPVRFVILPDVGPGQVPVVDIVTTLDVVDTVLTTSQSNLTRKHASIPPVVLPAGTYWFWMAGNGVQIAQATGAYDDGSSTFGLDADPDLEHPRPAMGDCFFTLEGNSGSPLPSCTVNLVTYPGGPDNVVGTVTAELDNNGGTAVATWNVTYAMMNGWTLAATNLDVQCDPANFPMTRRGNAQIFRFAHKGRHAPGTTEVTYTVDDPGCECVFFAAHAVVIPPNGGRSQTAWGEKNDWGDDFPGPNWGMYFQCGCDDDN